MYASEVWSSCIHRRLGFKGKWCACDEVAPPRPRFDASERPGPQCVPDLAWVVRFRKEAAACRKILLRHRFTPRSHDDLDRRPSAAGRVGELETIHRAGHVNAGKDHRDIATALQDAYGFIVVGGFDNLEARILNRFA